MWIPQKGVPVCSHRFVHKMDALDPRCCCLWARASEGLRSRPPFPLLSVSGHIVALASNDGTVKTLELKSGDLSSLVGHEDEVQSVIFDHKAEHLVSGGSDGTVRIWN